MSSDAYDSASPRGTPPPWTRIYRRGGRTAHLYAAGAVIVACDNPADPSMPSPGDESWYGTGSQDEHEQAARMPLCRACFRVREASYGSEGDDPARGGYL